MSNNTEEESQSTHQPESVGGSATVSSKGDTTAPATSKRRRSLPGNPDPDAEVVALSPRALLATNRYICEVCHKGFQRDQNLQLHRRGHNLPWKLKQRTTTEAKKRVYVCPEVSCAHHDPARALGDLTGIKKHYSRKHGEKKWKCDKCSKKYAVQSDWKAHAKICGTKEYRCDCGTIFSRRDSFVTHRAFCDALAEENYRANHGLATMVGSLQSQTQELLISQTMPSLNSSNMDTMMNSSSSDPLAMSPLISTSTSSMLFSPSASRAACLQLGGSSGGLLRMSSTSSSYMSATALLQKAAEMGAKVSDDSISPILLRGFTGYSTAARTSGPVHEALDDHIVDASRCLQAGDGSYMGNQSALQMSSKFATSDLRTSGFLQGAVTNPALQMNVENQNSMIALETSSTGDIREGRDRRMTQDFLGLGAVRNGSSGAPSYVESLTAGLSYSGEQQQNPHGVYAYQQGPTALEKPLWDF